MKRYISVIGAVALAAVSCSIDENRMALPGAEGTRLTLSGETTIGTKVSVGEKDGQVYPLLWVTGDVIKISTEGAVAGTEDSPLPEGTFYNEAAELFSEAAGRTSGVFQTTNSLVTTADTKLVITYPGTAVYSAGKLTSSIPAIQTQRSENSSLHVGNYALAYDNDVTMAAGQTEGITFQLEQKTAFVKMILSSSEYSGYNLTGAKLYAAGAALSGDASCDLSTGEVVWSNTSESVGAVISRPSVFSSTQHVYFTAIPCDLTSNSEVYAIISMENPNGNETVTLPIKISGGELKASCLSVIEVSGISSSSVAAEWKWYDPVETRDLVDGWAYGKQNTYMVEQKAKGEGDNYISIDVRARGDFSKVKEPKYYGLLTASSEMSTRRLVHLPNNVNAYESTPTNTVNSDYTIDVYVYDQNQAGRWAVVGIYDEDYNILWSFMIWRYIAGDAPKDVTYPTGDIVLLDRVLGASYSNDYAASIGKTDNPWAYFQWGRKDPFMWSNSNMTQYNQRLTPAGTDIADVIAAPTLINGYVSNAEANSNGDWQTVEHRPDLWGGVNNTTEWYDPNGVGHKTIYDPCPAGYRVPDARVFYEVRTNGQRWEFDNGTGHQSEDLLANNAKNPYTGDKTSVIAYPLGNNQYDYWPYAGAHWGSNAQWGNRTGSNARHGALYWANSVNPTDNLRAICLNFCYFSSGYNGDAVDAVRAQTFAVRCQKDTENR